MSQTKQTVICVAGMHRSGTSMVARLLNLCGMDLGPEAEMMPASDANPEGYWEHIWFNYCNNKILNFFQGGWDLVPVYPEGWAGNPGLDWIEREAKQRVAAFTSPVWGWKDPRNSITLAFWRRLIPELRTVICLRNPLDVAKSLNKRGSASILAALRLWWQYNSLLLLNTGTRDRVVTHFDLYFQQGPAELRRLADALGLQTTDDAITAACSTSKQSLRHSLTTLQQLRQECPWPGLVRTYCRLVADCGDAWQAVLGDGDEIADLAGQWTPEDCCLATPTCGGDLQRNTARTGEIQARITAMQEQLGSAQDREQELARQLAYIADAVSQACAQRDDMARQLAGAMGERDEAIAKLAGVTAHRDQVLEELAKAVRDRDNTRGELAGVAAHRDQVLAELARVTADRDATRAELNGVTEHRDHLQQVVTQTTVERDQARQELTDCREQAGREIAHVTGERDQAIAESAAIRNTRTWKLLSKAGLLSPKSVK